ncbi:hypothetical protein [Streptomyces sp. NPDC046909]|uniref:hypothetical protein n=1 Tax=Streptomyces sp. NPDC046909 TaxID=3155617 RepID=UPI0033CFF4C4
MLPLDTAQECFTYLVTGPKPLSVDCRDLLGLPNRSVALDELQRLLMRRACPRRTKDVVWAQLIRRSRSEGATWTLACVGMALPALAHTTGWLAARYPDDPFDVHAEVLVGFLNGLATIDLDRPQVLIRLKWAAYRRGFAALTEALDAPTPVAPGFRSTPPHPPWGHPDLVLARAVRAGVLTRTEADLIGSTRLGDESVTDWADGHGMTPEAVYKARSRSEHRLVAFIRDGSSATAEADPVANAAMADAAASERRRQGRRTSLSVSGSSARSPSGTGKETSTAVSKGAA